MRHREILSPHNPQVKLTARLRDARQRAKSGRMLIEGLRELSRALDAGLRPEWAYYLPEAASEPPVRELLARLEAAGTELLRTSPALFGKLAFGQRVEGILAVASAPRRELADLRLGPCPLVAVLEGVEKPGNVGAVLRSADAAGVSAVVIANGGTDVYNPQTIRASLGAVFTLSVATATSAATLEWLRARGLRPFAARVDATVDYTRAALDHPAALILGSESQGLSAVWRGTEVEAIRLPLLGHVDSLNVSAAAAVLFYEALRQRSGSSEPGSLAPR